MDIGVSSAAPGVSARLHDIGWRGVRIGNVPEDPASGVHAVNPTGDAAPEMLKRLSAPLTPDVLSVHTDLHAFWITHATLQVCAHVRMCR